jgi:hypothetical protein
LDYDQFKNMRPVHAAACLHALQKIASSDRQAAANANLRGLISTALQPMQKVRAQERLPRSFSAQACATAVFRFAQKSALLEELVLRSLIGLGLDWTGS